MAERLRTNHSILSRYVLSTLVCLIAAGAWYTAWAKFHPLARLNFLSRHSAAHPNEEASAGFVFARVQYTSGNGGQLLGDEQPGWRHSYPGAEQHILQLAREATGIEANPDSHAVVRLDSQELFRYPFLYFTEVGQMRLTENEAANLREYFRRGGFAMVDDFDGEESLDSFQAQMQRVFPGSQLMALNAEHPIFHTFFDIGSLDVKRPYTHSGGGSPKFYGYMDDHGRLCMIVNHDNNLGAFWSMIDRPRFTLAPSTESVKFGLDYFLYSLTH